MNHSVKINKSFLWTKIGLAIMTLMSLTKIVPSTSIAGYSVFAGIAFFFIVEASGKIPDAESGLRFKTFAGDMKKPWVLPLVLLPIAMAVAELLVGDLIFNGEFSAHVIARTAPVLSLNKLQLLVFQVIIAAFGEEIAWRGFFAGKGMKIFPFWIIAIGSSALFAIGHISAGSLGVVFYDIIAIFIDSIIYSVIYKKSGNCLVSTAAHILCNAAGITVTLLLM